MTLRLVRLPAVLGACVTALALAGPAAGQGPAPVAVPPPAAVPPSALPLVAVDPGHGGGDPGAIGRLPAGVATGLPVRGGGTRLYEKDVNLDVARRLDAALRARGYPTLLTRSQDLAGGDAPFTGVRADLRARVDAANGAGAGLFVSLHGNSHRDDSSGTETYHYYAAGPAGRALARAVQRELVARLGLPDRGVKGAGFYVLRHTRMPAILVEGGFLSNPSEALMLARPEVRQAVAEAVASGLDAYVRDGGAVGPQPVARPAASVATPPVRYRVTAGAFRRVAPARRLVRRLEVRGYAPVVRARHSARAGRRLYYVVTGQFAFLANARRQRAQLRALRLPAKVGSASPKAPA